MPRLAPPTSLDAGLSQASLRRRPIPSATSHCSATTHSSIHRAFTHYQHPSPITLLILQHSPRPLTPSSATSITAATFLYHLLFWPQLRLQPFSLLLDLISPHHLDVDLSHLSPSASLISTSLRLPLGPLHTPPDVDQSATPMARPQASFHLGHTAASYLGHIAASYLGADPTSQAIHSFPLDQPLDQL